MKLWKVLGVAGLAGVAATGAVIVRDQRQRTQMTPQEIRTRLHQRLEHASPENTIVRDLAPDATTRRGRLRRVRDVVRRARREKNRPKV